MATVIALAMRFSDVDRESSPWFVVDKRTQEMACMNIAGWVEGRSLMADGSETRPAGSLVWFELVAASAIGKLSWDPGTGPLAVSKTTMVASQQCSGPG